ncbi:hypothetical protein N836_28955 [Leptolyngbya sp. Heron Island J]|uniref:hypothetical protein n=1 Tax=Leptolyngbya sp. Heron Island J TaxID=1385935 RepID=UPI0003B9A00E|nr:hypothetical protein [Leptolyngbya sp. Heron Island J]ESA39108.1 hypothetical protein N836_28955 [Leptolyngbya sp. Heron Island J]
MPFIPLFIVIGIFLATSKILQPSQQGQRQQGQQRRTKYEQAYEEFDDTSLSLALIDYISRESRNKSDFDQGRKSSSKSEKRGSKNARRR